MHFSLWSLELHGAIWLFALVGALFLTLLSAILSLFVAPFKGKTGELRVRYSSLSGLPQETYHKFHDVLLKTLDGTTQIDHLLISRFGIFVIETKNWSGWIYGNDNDLQWTQVIYGKKYKQVNPIRQNYKHVRAVAATLKVPMDCIHPVVVFVGRCSFKTKMPSCVVRGWGLKRYVMSFEAPIFSKAEVLRLVSEIDAKRIPVTRASRRNHIDNVKKHLDPKAHWSCPQCAKPMVLRSVKGGPRAGQKFWGCSGYPKCRYTKNLS